MNKNLLVFFLLSGLAFLPGVAASELIWPLTIDISQSSSFAEFRGMRFHGGIDLRTRQTTGFPVKAIADGYVSRLKVQHRGFGYAMYVDHPKLKIRSVFGHLDDFADPMGEYARTKLKKMKSSYGIDDFFSAGKFPVKKGQVIGYTGETGLGPPHLHFELRTFADEPISPTSVGYQIPDRIIPVLVGITLDPLAAGTRINGQFLPYAIPVKKCPEGRYHWIEPVSISGKVGIQAGIVDQGEGGNRFGVEEIKVFLDDQLLFSRLFNRYSYDDNDQCPYVYDYHRSQRPGTGYVYTLFKWPMEKLEFSKSWPAWSGALESTSAGRRVLKITAVDFGGNLIVAEGPVVFEPPQPLTRQHRGAIEIVDWSYQPFSVTAIGKLPPPGADSVIVKTASGEEHALPLARKGNVFQINVPIHSRWAGGAFSLDGALILPPHTYLDAAGGNVIAPDGTKVHVPAGALNFPILSRWQARPDVRGKKALPARSSAWEFLPSDLVTHTSMDVLLMPPDMTPGNRLGIYCPNGKGYSCEGGSLKSGGIAIGSRISNTWIVLEDAVPPGLKFKEKRSIKRFGKAWVFRVSDVGEGVNYSSVLASADGKPLAIDSDPDKAEIYVLRPTSGKKPVALTVSIADHAGNRTENTEKRIP